MRQHSERIAQEKEATCRGFASMPAFDIMIDRKLVAAAAARIRSNVRHTPVLKGDLGIGAPVTMKLELLQHTGSFKPRGAFNRLLTATLPVGGVIAASGGNHGAAVAYAARSMGIATEIFVPTGTPTAKVARIAGYGAHVVRGGDSYAEALIASRKRQAETGALEVHAYDDLDVLAGQGTVGWEFEQAAPHLTHILVASGGGGLIGGIAAWYAGSAEIISVEPEACPGLHNALLAGQPTDSAVGGVAADSLGARRVGTLMFPIAQRFVSQAVLVSDESIRAAQRELWQRFRLVVEPGGATAIAAILSGRFQPPPGARVGAVLCGANTDLAAVAS
jgi:threonine dehydratase